MQQPLRCKHLDFVIDLRNPERFQASFAGSDDRGYSYHFKDHQRVMESGTAHTLRVIYLLFEEFKRGRLSADPTW